LPPEIRLHRSVEKFIDAKRVVATKSDEDDLDQAKHESAAISVALFSTFGVELTEEQKSSVAERLLEHLNGEALPAQGRHSIVLQKQWMSIDEAWSWQKGLVVALFLAGSTLYLLFIILLIVKGWNAIRTG
jgi:hypothetical protein